MDRKEAIAALKECQRKAENEWQSDPQVAHEMADEILCALLADLGYSDVAAEWTKVHPKWYA